MTWALYEKRRVLTVRLEFEQVLPSAEDRFRPLVDAYWLETMPTADSGAKDFLVPQEGAPRICFIFN